MQSKSDPGFLKNLPPHDRSCGWQHLAAASDDRHGYAIKKGHEIAARGDSYQRNPNCMHADFSVLGSWMASFLFDGDKDDKVESVCLEILEVPRLPSWQPSFLFCGMQVGDSGLRSRDVTRFTQDAHCTTLHITVEYVEYCWINLG